MLPEQKAKKDLIAEDFALKIIERFGTNDVYKIAESAGARIVRQTWHLVSLGEYERKTRTIFINRRAFAADESGGEELEKKIVAHELGHFFAAEFGFEKEEEEIFAAAFAAKLTGGEHV